MQGINLHAIARGAITAVNPDEIVTLYRADGQINVDGLVTPQYAAGVDMMAQWQPNDEKALEHAEKMNATKDTEQVFLYSDTVNPVAGLRRHPVSRTGDILRRGGQWYLVTSILENWSRVGWINVEVTLQTKPPDFSASDRQEGGGEGGVN